MYNLQSRSRRTDFRSLKTACVRSFCRIYLTARTQAQRIFDSHAAESFAAATSVAQAPKSKRRSSTPISDFGPKDTSQPPEEIVISDGLGASQQQQQATPSGNGRLDPSAGFVEKQLSRHDDVESDQNGTVVNNSLSTNMKSSDLRVDDFSAAVHLSPIAADSSTTAAATAESQSRGPGRRTWKMAAQLVTSAALTSAGARDGIASTGNGDSEGRWMTALSRVRNMSHGPFRSNVPTSVDSKRTVGLMYATT
jgi:hypothetical protein